MHVQAMLVVTISLGDLFKDSSTIISSKNKYFSTLRFLESTFTRIMVNFTARLLLIRVYDKT